MTKIKYLKNPKKEMVSRLNWRFHKKILKIKIRTKGSF